MLESVHEIGGSIMARSNKFRTVFTIVVTILLTPVIPSAQVLDEIIVTAQRRVQSLQDVPISIETISNEELTRQGYRDLIGLSDFTPGVEIRPLQEDTRVTIRGFGSTGNNLTQEQAAPIFLDGVHFGRQEQAKLAFMDVERIEVLKGPQPVFFGQNATAGAFNIISRKPTPEWEGNIDSELGNNKTQKLFGGIGGPITDTLGIRVAGKYDSSDGFLRNVIDGSRGPNYENIGGRVVLQWAPTADFTATGKYEKSRIRAGGQAGRLCLTGPSMVYGRNGPGTAGMGEVRSVWADPPTGSGWVQEHQPLPNANDSECFTGRSGVSFSGPWYDVPANVRTQTATAGALDIRRAGQAFAEDTSVPILAGEIDGILGYENLDSDGSYIDLGYKFADDLQLNWQVAYSGFRRTYATDNRGTPFLTNILSRGQRLDQWSSEVRLTSSTGGMFEWMLGGSWQTVDYDIWTAFIRADVIRGYLAGNNSEDNEGKSVFATVTFNFLDDKASIDLGGRYSDIHKDIDTSGHHGSWVMNVEPVSQPGYLRITDPSLHRIYEPYNPAAGLWYYTAPGPTAVPVEWRGSANAHAVGVTGERTNLPSNNPLYDELFIDQTEFDPQATLRYRYNDDLSFFARWAQAFKSGGFDSGQITLAAVDEFVFDSEYSETFEIGTKGNFWDGRGRFDLTLFQTKFKDLQLITLNPDPNNVSLTVNAGGQRVRGAEFGVTFAATDRLTVNLSGALMDAVMTTFKGAGCNAFEVATAPGSGCVLIDPNNPITGGFIDRSGSQAPYTPDWKFVGTVNYEFPVFEGRKINFNAKGYYSDGYFDDGESFTKTRLYGTHGDVNLSVGYGNMDDTWLVSLWARNILQATPRYHPENTVPAADTGFIQVHVDETMFTTYGLKFEYNFN